MKTIDLKAFRKANNLTQDKLGEYLGIKKSFISTIESDKDPMPKDKLSKLMTNPYGWDVSMLTQSDIVPAEKPVANDALVAELRAQIETLQCKLDNLNQKIGEQNALIKMLRQGGEESARDAGNFLSAGAL